MCASSSGLRTVCLRGFRGLADLLLGFFPRGAFSPLTAAFCTLSSFGACVFFFLPAGFSIAAPWKWEPPWEPGKAKAPSQRQPASWLRLYCVRDSSPRPAYEAPFWHQADRSTVLSLLPSSGRGLGARMQKVPGGCRTQTSARAGGLAVSSEAII